jgi:uncharacterized lipoprotein YddW (UPF0748 family)
VNGYTTIGITPELAAMMEQDWSEPVQVRARRGANGALELEFREPFAPAATQEDRERGYKIQPPARKATAPAVPPVSSGKGATRATDH